MQLPLFGKKKQNNTGDDELEVIDKTENDKSEINVKSRNPFSHLRKKARVMFKLRLKRKNADDDGAESVPGFDLGDGDGENKAKKKPKKEKARKEKPKKEKKQKEPKEKKPPKSKSSEGGEEENDGGGKIKPIIWIIVAASAIIIGVMAFFIFNGMLSKPSVEEQLITANQLLIDKKYTKAFKIYEKLLKQDETLVPAYVGWAEALHRNDQTDLALAKLTTALPLTNNDPKIQAKIDELKNPPPEAEGPKPEETDAESSAEASESEEVSEEASEESSTEPTPQPATIAVTFSDPAFETMIRLALQKPDSEKITGDELSAITSLKILGNTHAAASGSGNPDAAHSSLSSINRVDSYTVRGVTHTERGTIQNLNDLKYFTGLQKLVVAYNSITDVSGISELKNLNTVGLYCNEIVDITPLSKLDSLEYLYIYNNHISDLSPLASLTKMRQLWLNENNISDIAALKDFDQLRELFLTDNEVRDISAVAGMKALTVLHFANNQVTDISAVKGLESLGDISYLNNPVGDASPASHIKRINQPYY